MIVFSEKLRFKMKYITIKLTTSQALYLYRTLSYDEGYVQDNSYPKSYPTNAYVERIRQRIGKELAPAMFGGLTSSQPRHSGKYEKRILHPDLD